MKVEEGLEVERRKKGGEGENQDMKIEGWSDQSILYTNIKCHNGTRYSVQVIHNKEEQKFTNDENLNCLNASEVSLRHNLTQSSYIAMVLRGFHLKNIEFPLRMF